jgi:hypothetical protein
LVFKQKLINFFFSWFSSNYIPLARELTRLFSEFFLAPSRLPKHFSWLDALLYVKYTFVGTALNELYGLNLTCTPADRARYSCIVNGETFIRERGYDYININVCIHI